MMKWASQGNTVAETSRGAAGTTWATLKRSYGHKFFMNDSNLQPIMDSNHSWFGGPPFSRSHIAKGVAKKWLPCWITGSCICCAVQEQLNCFNIAMNLRTTWNDMKQPAERAVCFRSLFTINADMFTGWNKLETLLETLSPQTHSNAEGKEQNSAIKEDQSPHERLEEFKVQAIGMCRIGRVTACWIGIWSFDILWSLAPSLCHAMNSSKSVHICPLSKSGYLFLSCFFCKCAAKRKK